MASVHDARNDAIFGKQLTVYSQPPTMTTPTPPLSPAAQAVWDAYKTGGLDAALIALVDQFVYTEMVHPDSWGRCHPQESIDPDDIRDLANELRQEGR